MSEHASPSDRMASSYKQLAASAQNLNAASDDLGGAIAELDGALKQLNLGVSAWVEIDSSSDEETGAYEMRELGYDKIGDRWGIAVREQWGNHFTEDRHVDTWSFSDSPRSHRIDAVEHFAALLDRLVESADQTTEKLKQRTAQARELTVAIGGLPTAVRSRKPGAAR